MSIKGDIYKAIQAQLVSKLDGSGNNPKLAWFAKFNNQLTRADEGYPIPLPAVFMTYGFVEWENLAKNVQEGEALVRFHVAFENYADDFEGSVNQEQAIAYWDFVEAVHLALEGFSADSFSPLHRVTEEEPEDHDNVIETILTYRCTITDETALADRNNVLVANPVVNVTEPITSRPVRTVTGAVDVSKITP